MHEPLWRQLSNVNLVEVSEPEGHPVTAGKHCAGGRLCNVQYPPIASPATLLSLCESLLARESEEVRRHENECLALNPRFPPMIPVSLTLLGTYFACTSQPMTNTQTSPA